MGRQRTISDENFWRSNRLASLTQEDKATLLYLLTSPFSNIIGCFKIVPRIAAAEMGWAEDQLLKVLKRLGNIESTAGEVDELVRYDPASNTCWVKVWWEHNNPRLALSAKVGVKAREQIKDFVPPGWLNEFIETLAEEGIDTPSIGYPYPMDTSGSNCNCISNSNPTTTPVDKSGVADQKDSSSSFSVFFEKAGNPDCLKPLADHLSKALKSAKPEQAKLAGTAWKEAVEAGKAKDPGAYAHQLCKAAAVGAVFKPQAVRQAEEKKLGEDKKKEWDRLKALAGCRFLTDKGEEAVITDQGFVSLKAGVMAGNAALQALKAIETKVWQSC